MLLGMPVISTYAGGIPSLITDGTDGLLVQDGDPWSLAGAIIDLVRDRELAVRLGQNARERASRRHDPQKVVNDLLFCYQSIIYSTH
jgi:glycosyltransferase involved in cell wall biosynthesis